MQWAQPPDRLTRLEADNMCGGQQKKATAGEVGPIRICSASTTVGDVWVGREIQQGLRTRRPPSFVLMVMMAASMATALVTLHPLPLARHTARTCRISQGARGPPHMRASASIDNGIDVRQGSGKKRYIAVRVRTGTAALSAVGPQRSGRT